MKKEITRLICAAICCTPIIGFAQTGDKFTSTDNLYKEGKELFQEKNYAAALPALKAFVKQKPAASLLQDAEYMLVSSAYELKDKNRIELLRKYLDRYPDTPYANRIYALLASCYFYEGKYDEALALFNSADLDLLGNEERDDCTYQLAHSTGRLNIRHTEELVKVLSDLKNAGHEVILVSSGAIGMGVGKLSLSARPTDMSSKQACAAVGQCELMYTYDRLFSAYDHTVAQILLTGVDIEHASRRENIQNTLTRLLELGALPIINENDTVATDEITSIGDNDTLAAIVTCCIKADLLVLLSDIDGLYTANPHTHPDAKLIPLVEDITPEVMALADGAGSALGTGGMSTKLRAARMVTSSGADMVIANGAHPELLYDIAEGRAAGTRFAAHRQEA
jgi:glutamate 5-kinase